MEKQIVVLMSEVKLFDLTCPNSKCGARFVRTLDELVNWYEMADPQRGMQHEPFCPSCRKKEAKRHEEIRATIGKVFDLWRSPRWQEIKLSFVVSERGRAKEPGQGKSTEEQS